MRSLFKIMLAAVLGTGTGFIVKADVTHAYHKPANGIEERHISGFNSVSTGGSFDVHITQGSTESVKIDAPADVMEYIVTEVEGKTLKIHSKNNSGNIFRNKKVVIYVSAKELQNISLSGSGSVYFEDGIKANSLNLSVSGSGNMAGKVNVQTLENRISGSGNMKLNGNAVNSNVSVSGSGNYNGENVKTVNTAARVSGSGNAKVNASTKVEASVSGSGNVRYTGGATDVSKSKSGSGSIGSF